jgi:sarcosine oxidase subunit delta
VRKVVFRPILSDFSYENNEDELKLLKCPVNGWRPLDEFLFGGELRAMPDPGQATDAQWADYVFNRSGEPGIRREWWYHLASGTWFVAEHDTLNDSFLRTYLYHAGAAE